MGKGLFITYLLGARETVCLVILRPAMFPEAQPFEYRRSKDHKAYCFPEDPVIKSFIIISSVKVNDSIKQDKNCFYCTYFVKKLNITKRTREKRTTVKHYYRFASLPVNTLAYLIKKFNFVTVT